MAEEQIQIETLPLEQYKAARESGATTTIDKSALEDNTPPQITGKEDLKEYKEKRDEQQNRQNPKGFQKKIDRLVKERSLARQEAESLKQQLARYETPQTSDEQGGDDEAEQRNVSDDRHSEEERHGEPEKQRESSSREPKIEALRQRYPDFDYVMDRAKSQKMRIADEAANVLHSLDNRSDVAYLLARNDGLRVEFNKLPPARQVEEIQRMSHHIAGIENGAIPFAEKVRASLPAHEVEAIVEGIKKNPLGDRIATSLARELHDLSNGPEVLKELIHDPELSKKLAGMSQTSAALELGRISARLERDDGDDHSAKKQLPTPITPVGRGFSKTSSVPLDELDMKSFKAARSAGRVR